MNKLTTINFAFALVFAIVLAAPVSAFDVVHFTGDGNPEAVGFNAGSNSFDIDTDTDENGPAPGFLVSVNFARQHQPRCRSNITSGIGRLFCGSEIQGSLKRFWG